MMQSIFVLLLLLNIEIFFVYPFHSFAFTKQSSLPRPSHLSLRSTLSSKPTIAPSDVFSPFDTNRDGKISMGDFVEGSVELMRHSPLITSLMTSFKQFLTGKRCTMSSKQLIKDLRNLISLSDILIISLCLCFYKPLLKQLYRFQSRYIDPSVSFDESLVGRMERPIQLLIIFPILLFLIDFISIFLVFFGFQFHIKANIPQFFSNLSFSFITGLFMTRLKDWISFHVRRSYWRVKQLELIRPDLVSHNDKSTGRDKIQEKTTDELTSAIIWAMVGISWLQTLSNQFGVGIKSIFALGGLGSASFVLALRSTMENLLGGLLLRLQDKFRINEKITIPNSKEEGFIESIQWLSTKLRRDDDSTITVPNANFIQGEVINWSRTPYRLFRTTITLKESNIRLLPEIIENIRVCLLQDSDIESKDRDLIVAATGFSAGNIIVEINARLKGNNDATICSIKTRVVDKIASEVDNVFKRNGLIRG